MAREGCVSKALDTGDPVWSLSEKFESLWTKPLPTHFEGLPPRVGDNESTAPPLLPKPTGEGQLRGETPEEFIARKTRSRLVNIARETPQKKTSRETKEALAKAGIWTRRSTVYEWILEDDTWIRRRVVRSLAKIIFEEDEGGSYWQQREYWYHGDEWDLFPHGCFEGS